MSQRTNESLSKMTGHAVSNDSRRKGYLVGMALYWTLLIYVCVTGGISILRQVFWQDDAPARAERDQ